MLRRVVFALALLAGSAVPAFAQGMTLFPPRMQFFDNTTGLPLAAGVLYTCQVGSACPGTTQATWSDVALSTPNGAAITLDSSGRLPNGVYTNGATYKLVLQSSTGTTEFTQDNVPSPAGYNIATLQGTTVPFQAATVLTLASNTVTPTRSLHALDTSGGAQNLNTITTSGVTAPFILYLYANNPGANPVTVTSTGNVVLSQGSFTLSTSASWLILVLRGSTWYELARQPVPLIPNLFLGCGVRATLTSGTPVTLTDVTAATTVYIDPFSTAGWSAGVCAFHDGTANWTSLAFTEISIPLGTLTSGLPYDIFCYNNAGVMACDAPVAWSSVSARFASGPYAINLPLQNGIYVKSTNGTAINSTRRYIASFYTDSTTTTSDAGAGSATSGRHLYNYYNRVLRPLTRIESTASWTYTTATWRQTNGSTSNQVQILQGVAETPITLAVFSAASNAGGAGVNIGIGEDSTTTPLSGAPVGTLVTLSTEIPVSMSYTKIPAVGHHVYASLEISAASGTTTFYGLQGNGSTFAIIGSVIQ